MAETTIQWCDFTMNPWRGCTKISPGCSACYADTMSKRNPGTLGVWGPNGTRVVAAESYWKQPLKWNKEAAKCEAFMEGQGRPRVFCASLADIFEAWDGPMLNAKGERLVVYEPNGGLLAVPIYAESPGPHCRWLTMQDVREHLFRLIDRTPNLDWLILTKRPENIAKMAVFSVGNNQYSVCDPPFARKNIWLGVSIEDQQRADERIPLLLKVPAAVRFLSCEPLLGPVDLSAWLETIGPSWRFAANDESNAWPGIDWAIVGCESGYSRREMKIEWAKSLASQCRAAGVAFFLKQVEVGGRMSGEESEWPEDLQGRREFPR